MEANKNGNEQQQCNTVTLGMATVPCQNWSELYDLTTALNVGTIFKDLHKPFYMGGDANAR